MDKKFQIKFHAGRIYEIDLHIIASLIANKEFEGRIDSAYGDEYIKRVQELQEDEFKIFEFAYDIPWSVLKEYAVEISEFSPQDEWLHGNCTISVIEFI